MILKLKKKNSVYNSTQIGKHTPFVFIFDTHCIHSALITLFFTSFVFTQSPAFPHLCTCLR